MDIILASSRGRGIEEEIWARPPYPENVKILSMGGGSLQDLQFTAYDLLYDHPDPTNCHVYLFAGLCDVTKKESEKNYTNNKHYEEVIYNENPKDTVEKITTLIDKISAHILYFAAKPIFCPIITMNIQHWNYTRLDQHKTSFLLHHKHYADMQQLLNRSIDEINRYIHTVNTNNDMVTPFLADTIMTKSNTQQRIHYTRLSDGVHASEDLREKWAKCICRAIKFNRDFPAQRSRLFQ